MLRKLLARRDRKRREKTAAELRRRFFDELERRQPGVFVEVGAYDGAAAIEARRILPSARIVSFEANPTNHAHFARVLRHEVQGVEFLHSAIADHTGTLTFRIAYANEDGLSKKSSLLQRSAEVKEREVSVPCISLDAFFRDAPSRFALWIDVEGASREVLTGAERILTATDLLLIEVEERRFWEGQWLKEDTLAHLAKFGLQPAARDYEYDGQHNVLLTRVPS